MPATVAQRLDALEAENARLTAEFAALKGEPSAPPAPALPVTPQPAPYVETRPTQTVILPSAGPMPSDDELRELQRIVFAANPTWQHETQRGIVVDHFRQFKNAFRALGRLGRTEQLDGKHDISWFLDLAASTADRANGHHDFGAEFMAAVFAWGDISYRDWNASSPPELGLTYPSAGRSARDDWRGILKAGKFIPRGAPVHEMRNDRVGLHAGPTR